MEARHLATIQEWEGCWEQLADDYQNLDLGSYVARARILVPGCFYKEPETGEVEGEVMDENETYILTWEDGIGECVRIYEKIV